MRAEEFLELVRTRPFIPLRVHMTDGRTFDVRHPDQVLVLRGRIDIGIPAEPENPILERVEHCPLSQVVSVEELSTPA